MWKWGLNRTPGTTNICTKCNIMNNKNADLAAKTDGLHTLTPHESLKWFLELLDEPGGLLDDTL